MDLAGNDSRPLAERAADMLRERITRGELKPGERLPSESALAEEWGVSRDTVRRAISQLTQEGLLMAGRGRAGRFVRSYAYLTWPAHRFEHTKSRRDTAPGAQADAWAEDVTAQGRKATQEIEIGIVIPPAVVAQYLAVQPKDSVVVRKRLRYVDGIPFQTADSYYPRDVAEGTPIMQPGDVTVPGGLMANAGHRQVRFLDRITIRMPTHAESTRLSLPSSTPIAEHLRVGYNKDDRPVRVIITILPGDRHVIEYEVDGH
ncbi:GntR family transcriptional regulator [Micromonospora sp. NPDC049662]|uniref:GntR family transcriptional regulator n=1 Tax=Micromonospora sp. NPDC049662 TaxID=3155397 RepID=UPI003442D26C